MLEKICRQIDLSTKLLGVIATDKDFSSHTQEQQIAILGKLGFRNKELSEIFGIKPQQVNNAFRKFKLKRS
ncbi:MAG: hypothetical protein HY514_00355 [Candidatus Aenigmarchaeota archaeon]|nr:hypothetical protein [Candidatus Aenigmarchaeota archaeon]